MRLLSHDYLSAAGGRLRDYWARLRQGFDATEEGRGIFGQGGSEWCKLFE
jgi:hypothetical protein